jgi:hypothetical protein
MDSVDIPFFSGGESIATALKQMRAKNRSGVVVEGEGGYQLLHAGDLLYARDKGLAALGEVGGGHPVILLQKEHVKEFELNSVNPKSTWEEYETLLQNVGHRYTLLSATGNTATLVTASELDALSLTLTGGYQCDGTPTHYFPQPRVSDGEDCPKWPECNCPGGRKPKVHPAP